MAGNGNERAGGDGEQARGVTRAGPGAAAFPVGVLAGAAIGGVGGALVGDETPAGADRAAARERGSPHADLEERGELGEADTAGGAP